MQCIILAGGMGTRILPLSENIPKALIDINGKPFAHYQLSWLAKHGVTEVVYCIGHLGYKIKEYFGYEFNGLSIKYVDEGENLIGTAGAIRLAFDQNILNKSFGIIYGDSFLPINIKKEYDLFLSYKCPIMMTVLDNKDKLDKSNVIFRDDYSILYDKNRTDTRYIDYGLSFMRCSVIKGNIPSKTKYDLSSLFNILSLKNKIFGNEIYERFYEVGSFKGIEDFKAWVRNNESVYNT